MYSGMKNLRLLIVDDSELMCSHLARILKDIDGVEITGVALTMEDAFRSIAEDMPDVAILDICLPGGSGIDLLKKIKEGSARTRVLMYTHYPYPPYERKCRKLGADYFFDKHSDFDRLLNVVKQLADESLRGQDLKLCR